MLSRALAVALLLVLPSVASAQVPVRFGFPNGAPWCAFGFDCRFLNFRECADWIYDPARNCLRIRTSRLITPPMSTRAGPTTGVERRSLQTAGHAVRHVASCLTIWLARFVDDDNLGTACRRPPIHRRNSRSSFALFPK